MNNARETGVRAIAITDFQNADGFMEAAQAIENLRRDAELGPLDSRCSMAWKLCWRTGA